MISGAVRKLTRAERASIRKLVITLCANYYPDYGCLPLDAPCYMLDKWETGSYCKYFTRGVLPLNPMLEASIFDCEAPESDICASCGKSFIPQGKQLYCSAACQVDGNRRKSRARMRKKRQRK
jgi:hypothetical protein